MIEKNFGHRYRFSGSRWTVFAVCGFVLTCCFAVFSLIQPSFITRLDGACFDGLTTGETTSPGGEGPVVVALDDESLARFGRWPWPRELMARLMARIAEQKPAAVGVDVIFPEPENVTGSGRGAEKAQLLSSGDLALARSLSGGPFVLGYELIFGRPDSGRVVEQGVSPLDLVSRSAGTLGNPRERLWRADGMVGSLPVFFRHAGASGFLNGVKERDGVLRRMPVIIEQGGDAYPSLALATLLRSRGVSDALLESTWWGDLELKVGERRIPLDDRGRLLLRYRGYHSGLKQVSASSLLDGNLPPGALAGRIVLLGATATGMGDLVVTPLDRMLSGVQLHAIAADNILRSDFARQAPWIYSLLFVAVAGLLATLTCIALPTLRGAMMLFVAVAGAWWGAAWLFRAHGLFLSPVLPLATLLMVFSLLSLLRLFHVECVVARQSHDLAKARDFIMTSMAALAEIRDTETGGHIMRTQRYLHALCTEISRHPRFKPLLDRETIELVSKLAVLHDIGKVGIDDKLLRKPARFTPEEYEAVKKHALHGKNALTRAELRAGDFSDELLNYAKDIAYSHHERWDGGGYPEGLRGDNIPWAARLMSVADVYDALVSRRVYKEPVPHEEAVRIISNGRGGQFDPDVVDAFLRVEASWRRIALDLADSKDVKVELK